jgi:NAD(P)-dependent dehydrogenase (short-subunit alcohol dehydrogenase family)
MFSTADKTITLITGANCGIGFALCALLLESPSAIVLLGSRSAAKGEAAVTSLKERNLPGTVELVVIDVDSEESVENAAKQVESKHGRYTTPSLPVHPTESLVQLTICTPSLDALVNNAAIAGSYLSNTSHTPSPLSAGHQLLAALRTNTVGPALTVAAFAGLLEKSEKTARVINVTSGAGSISLRLDDTNPHQTMKYVMCLLSPITNSSSYTIWKLELTTITELGSLPRVQSGAAYGDCVSSVRVRIQGLEVFQFLPGTHGE